VKQDLLDARLVRLPIEDIPEQGPVLPMFAVYDLSTAGSAGRWLTERLKQCPEPVLPPDGAGI